MINLSDSASNLEQFNDAGDPIVFSRVAYIPYLQSLVRKGAPKHCVWIARFQGGEVDLSLKLLNAVMFYGVSGDLPVEFLSDAGDCGVGVIFHTRHKKTPLTLMPGARADRNDILGAQILARHSKRKSLVVAKAFVIARISQMHWLLSGTDERAARVRAASSLAEVRAIEAESAKLYWAKYFRTLNMDGCSRRQDNPVSKALDALSAFTAPLFLRWLAVHGLSANHGYLHEPTSYEALAFDLMESVRHWSEQVVYQEVLEGGTDNLTARATSRYKHLLEEWVEVPSLQVSAKRKFVLYGMVLALRSYLLGEINHVHLPMDSVVRSRGRPVKVSYKIPGAVKRIR